MEGIMDLVRGKQVKTRDEATSLALLEAAAEGMTSDVPVLFRWAIDAENLSKSARAVIGRAVHAEYGKRTAWWVRKIWYVPVPRLSYSREGVGHLGMNITVYLVANVGIEVGDYIRPAIAVGQVGKPERMLLPITLLWALIEGDRDRFRIVAKDGLWTTFEIPGMKAVKLHDGLLDGLARVLDRAPLDRVLQRFGIQAEGIIPLVVQDLLRLILGQAVLRPHLDLEALEETLGNSLGYSQQEARELMARADLRTDDSQEEALRKVLAQADKGG